MIENLPEARSAAVETDCTTFLNDIYAALNSGDICRSQYDILLLFHMWKDAKGRILLFTADKVRDGLHYSVSDLPSVWTVRRHIQQLDEKGWISATRILGSNRGYDVQLTPTGEGSRAWSGANGDNVCTDIYNNNNILTHSYSRAIQRAPLVTGVVHPSMQDISATVQKFYERFQAVQADAARIQAKKQPRGSGMRVSEQRKLADERLWGSDISWVDFGGMPDVRWKVSPKHKSDLIALCDEVGTDIVLVRWQDYLIRDVTPNVQWVLFDFLTSCEAELRCKITEPENENNK